MASSPIEIGPVGKLVAANIAMHRRVQGLSQQELCDRLAEAGRPMSRAAVSTVETFARRVDVDDLVAFAQALGTTAGHLLGEGRSAGPALPLLQPLPELPCPKCGNPDTTMTYVATSADCRDRMSSWKSCSSSTPDGEHFHRECRRCRYHWRTDDVLSKEVDGA